jgi:hypothetical protein
MDILIENKDDNRTTKQTQEHFRSNHQSTTVESRRKKRTQTTTEQRLSTTSQAPKAPLCLNIDTITIFALCAGTCPSLKRSLSYCCQNIPYSIMRRFHKPLEGQLGCGSCAFDGVWCHLNSVLEIQTHAHAHAHACTHYPQVGQRAAYSDVLSSSWCSRLLLLLNYCRLSIVYCLSSLYPMRCMFIPTVTSDYLSLSLSVVSFHYPFFFFVFFFVRCAVNSVVSVGVYSFVADGDTDGYRQCCIDGCTEPPSSTIDITQHALIVKSGVFVRTVR